MFREIRSSTRLSVSCRRCSHLRCSCSLDEPQECGWQFGVCWAGEKAEHDVADRWPSYRWSADHHVAAPSDDAYNVSCDSQVLLLAARLHDRLSKDAKSFAPFKRTNWSFNKISAGWSVRIFWKYRYVCSRHSKKRVDVRSKVPLRYAGWDPSLKNVIIIHGFNGTESKVPMTYLRDGKNIVNNYLNNIGLIR